MLCDIKDLKTMCELSSNRDTAPARYSEGPLFRRSAIPKVLYVRRARSGGWFWGKAPGLGFRVSFWFGLELGY
jgi:hypothetical protein